MKAYPRILGILLITVTFDTSTLADENDAEKRARAGRLEVMTKRWQLYRASLVRDDKEIEVAPLAQPLLRWHDPARNDTPIKDGTLWAWGAKGRPMALLAQETHGGNWSCELISASTDRIVVVTDAGWRWSPEKPGLQLREFEDAPPPSKNAALRLAQMKGLARRFRITQIDHNEMRSELRLMSRPTRRYDDASSGLIDGAMFVYARGTNPETIVVIECQRKRSGHTWLYGFLPLTVSRVEAMFDDKNVWTRPHAYQPRTQEPYTAYASD